MRTWSYFEGFFNESKGKSRPCKNFVADFITTSLLKTLKINIRSTVLFQVGNNSVFNKMRVGSSTNQLFIKLGYSPSFNATTRQQSLFSTRKETFLHALQCKGGGGQGGEITPFHIIQFAEVFSTKICIKVGTIDEIFQSEPVLEGLLG